MLDVLEQVERELPDLLLDDAGWKTLKINYHPPFVDRVFRSWGDYRVSLHRIHPCRAAEALFHPHPWPSAMHMLSGIYEMAVGYGPGQEPPPHAARLVSAGGLKYEMTERDAWHYVRPIGENCMTIMVTGPAWDRWSPGRTETLQPLSSAEKEAILIWFRQRFPITPK